MVLTYSGRSAPSAKRIADSSHDIFLHRGSRGDINWGRAIADTQLNPDISNVTNKRHMRQLFEANEVPMPRLWTARQAYRLVANGIAVVGRPDYHSGGRGFWLCRTEADVTKAIRGTHRKRPATHFMDYIDAPREYRVHIFRGKSIRLSEKIFSSFHDYTTAKPRHNIKHVRRAAKKAVKAVGLDFGAVDVLANDTQCWVLEVNSSPGLGGSMPSVYAAAFEKWREETGDRND